MRLRRRPGGSGQAPTGRGPATDGRRTMSEWREEWREANRESWDERVPIHTSSGFYDVASFKAGQERLQPFEVSEVGDVSGKDLLHLQCHFGMDTLSWARRGARVTGLDFSAPAVEAAKRLAAGRGVQAASRPS